jgi:hypothetical protein
VRARPQHLAQARGCGGVVLRPYSEEQGERQLETVRSTRTDDCIHELENTGERWEGWDDGLQLYSTFLAAFSGMRWVLQTVVIGRRASST